MKLLMLVNPLAGKKRGNAVAQNSLKEFNTHGIKVECRYSEYGGPIYCTDMAGKQNWDVLSRVQLCDGTILRPDEPGRPTMDCLFQSDENKPYKVFSKVGKTGLLGVWNLSGADSVSGCISPSDIYGLEGKSFAVYEHFSGECKRLKRNECIDVQLNKYGCKLYLVQPIHSDMSPFGLVDKFIAPAGIIEQKFQKGVYYLELKQGGVFGAYLKQAPKAVLVNGRHLLEKDYSYKKQLLKIVLPGKEPVQLQIHKSSM